jgi:hypothetical protein
MKYEKLKRMLLPMGLLCVSGVSMLELFMRVEVPDFVNGFLKGVGIALIISALFIQRSTKFCKNSWKN